MKDCVVFWTLLLKSCYSFIQTPSKAVISLFHIRCFSTEPAFLGAGEKHCFTDAIKFGAKILRAISQCLYNRLNREPCNKRLVHNLASWQQKRKNLLKSEGKSILAWNNSEDDEVARKCLSFLEKVLRWKLINKVDPVWCHLLPWFLNLVVCYLQIVLMVAMQLNLFILLFYHY